MDEDERNDWSDYEAEDIDDKEYEFESGSNDGGDDDDDGDGDDDDHDDGDEADHDDHDDHDCDDANSSFSSVLETSLDQWQEHLTLPHGGEYRQDRAKEARKRVRSMAAVAASTNSSTLADVWGNPDRLWTRFFKVERDLTEAHYQNPNAGLKKGKLGTTLQHYSRDLERYCEFLLQTNFKSPISINKVDRTALKLIHALQPKWRKSLTKDCNYQRNHQMERDRKNLLFVEEVKALYTSPLSIACEQMYRKIQAHHDATGEWPQLQRHADIYVYRDYLIFTLTVLHAARAGNLLNLTVSEFNDRHVVDAEQLRIAVHNHKNANLGVAELFIDRKMEASMLAYLGYIRPHLSGANQSANFFLTDRSSPVRGISLRIKSYTKKTGCWNTNKKLNSTQIRKMWVSELELQEVTLDNKNELAQLMKHSRRTAERWYDVTNKTTAAARAASSLRRQLDSTAPTTTCSTSSTTHSPSSTATSTANSIATCTATSTASSTASSIATCTPTSPASSIATSTAISILPLTTVASQPSSSTRFTSGRSPYHAITGKYKWSSSDELTLKRCFKKMICNNKIPSRPLVRKVFQSVPEAAIIWNMGDSDVWHNKCISKVKDMQRTYVGGKLH